jgi:hypothetical protein
MDAARMSDVRHYWTGKIMLDCVQGEGDVRDQVRHAIKATQGEDRVVTEIRDETAQLGPSFPDGTLYFLVRSESVTCTHEPHCTWYDHVFHCKDCCVVLTEIDMRLVSVRQIKDALASHEHKEKAVIDELKL